MRFRGSKKTIYFLEANTHVYTHKEEEKIF